MSAEAVFWASHQTPASSGAKFILIALAGYADKSGSCYPSRATLGRFVIMSAKPVDRHLATLEKQGYITRTPRHHADGGRMSDHYQLNMSAFPVQLPPTNAGRNTQ